MNAPLTEAVALLQDSGMLDRLKAEAQVEREAERAELLARLADAEMAEVKRAETAVARRSDLDAKIARLAADLDQARKERLAIEDGASFTIEKTRGKLRKLADPSIEVAIRALGDLSNRARNAFAGNVVIERQVRGVVRHESSNALEIADAMALIRQAQADLHALQEAARPADLPAVIEAKLAPCREAVRGLHGL